MVGRNTGFRIARTVHAWSGALLALLLTVIGSTGALLVWKEDYIRATVPAARAHFTPTPEAVARVALGAEGKFGAGAIALIYFPTETLGVGQATLQNGDLAYVDGDGVLVARWRVGERFEDWLFDLHHRLLLGNTGLVTVGFAGIAVAFLALSGAIAFWPFRRGLRAGVAPKSVSRSGLLMSHRNIGIISALPIAIAALAGVALSFPEDAQKFLVHDTDAVQEEMSAGLDTLSGAEVAGWGPSMARAHALFPDAVIRAAAWPSPGAPDRIIRLQQRGAWSRLGDTYVYIDATGGYMDVKIDPNRRGWGARLLEALYPLHTARMDNWIYKTYATVVGVALATLGIFGFCAFVQRFKPAASAGKGEHQRSSA